MSARKPKYSDLPIGTRNNVGYARILLMGAAETGIGSPFRPKNPERDKALRLLAGKVGKFMEEFREDLVQAYAK